MSSSFLRPANVSMCDTGGPRSRECRRGTSLRSLREGRRCLDGRDPRPASQRTCPCWLVGLGSSSERFCGRSFLVAVRYRRATRPRRCRWQSRRGDFRDLRVETQRSCASWTMRRLAVGAHGGADGRLVLMSPALAAGSRANRPAAALVQISAQRRPNQLQPNPTSRRLLYCR